ncbi:MAG TPA: peptide deformylase [Crocinitomicaceae bacterium]|nr:peptide deformylase [Crocinitomicaceae bacterium]
MILPIVAYGDPVLKRKADEVEQSHPDLQTLIDNMFETMYEASGVGLAAPQIGKSIRLSVIDGSPFADKDEDEEDDPLAEGIDGFKKVFINPQILEETGEEWAFNEGCLSIPKVREDVYRKPKIRVQYFDENWQKHDEVFEGYKARIIQHEYDHIEGILFTDKLSAIRKKLISKKLANISKGLVSVDYKMKFPLLKKGR